MELSFQLLALVALLPFSVLIGGQIGPRSSLGTVKNENADVWLTVHRNSVWIRKTNWMSLFVFFFSLLIVAQHVSGNHVPIIRS